MRKSLKIWLIVAVSIVVVGAFIFVGALAVLGFDFTRLSTVKYETNTYEVDADFNKIFIDVDTTEIVFVPSDDGKCRVVCFEEEKVKHSAMVQNGTLVIDTVDTRKWYDYIGISFGNTKMTVYLPDYEYASLSIDTDTGDIAIPKDFTFENLEINGYTADVECLASVSNVIKMKTSTGDVKIDTLTAGEIDVSTNTGSVNINSVTAKGNVEIETDTGEVKLTDVSCADFTAESDTGTITLKNVVAVGGFSIESDTGDVEFENSDALQIFVKTSTGDVTGTLLSQKVFITKTSTGDISVPKSITGGRCEITTSTGDIKINIH